MTKSPVFIYRLPNVFGKWCKPNYNSVVATFCYNTIHSIPIQIDEKDAILNLVHVDDVIKSFRILLAGQYPDDVYVDINPTYQATVGELAAQIELFHSYRGTAEIEAVGKGLLRLLYSTYLTYLTPEKFSYPLLQHQDSRGVFVEILKTNDFGQISYFTAHPGVTRGGHFHHIKAEKFIVIEGCAQFRFRHISSDETFALTVSGELPQVVETVPGWSHEICNVGEDKLIVIVWANEIFDPENPDTFSFKV